MGGGGASCQDKHNGSQWGNFGRTMPMGDNRWGDEGHGRG